MSNYKYANSGFNPKLIENVSLVGKYDMPLIKKEEIEGIKEFIPFEKEICIMRRMWEFIFTFTMEHSSKY